MYFINFYYYKFYDPNQCHILMGLDNHLYGENSTICEQTLYITMNLILD